VKYQMVLKLLDEEAGELGEVEGHEAASPQSAAKNVLQRFEEMRNEAGRLKKPVDLSDDLKGAARRFGA
jgi:hypothetical protein